MSGDSRHQLPRLEIPGQTSVNVTQHPGSSIQHHPITQKVAGGVNITLCGGLTKLEWVATQLLSGNIDYTTPEVVDLAIETAEYLLKQCHRRQHGRTDSEGNGEE